MYQFSYFLYCLGLVLTLFSKKNVLSASVMLYLDDTFEEEDVIQIVMEMEQNRKNSAIPHWNYDRSMKY